LQRFLLSQHHLFFSFNYISTYVTLCVLYSARDNTRRGHILGAAPQTRIPSPERQMSAASTSVVRLLLHMSMYLGATESPQVSVYLLCILYCYALSVNSFCNCFTCAATSQNKLDILHSDWNY